MEEYLQPLDDIIDDMFIPSLLGSNVSSEERELFKRPVKDGGLGIPNLSEKAKTDYESSRIITGPLAETIVNQGSNIPSKECTKNIRSQRSRQISELQKLKEAELMPS